MRLHSLPAPPMGDLRVSEERACSRNSARSPTFSGVNATCSSCSCSSSRRNSSCWHRAGRAGCRTPHARSRSVLAEIKRLELDRAVHVEALAQLAVDLVEPHAAPARRSGTRPMERDFRRTPHRAARARAGDRRRCPSRTATCSAAASRPRAKRSRRWGRSISMATRHAGRPTRWSTGPRCCGSSTRRCSGDLTMSDFYE